MAEWIGIWAGIFTTACFVPQVWHVMRTRETKSISLIMYIMFTFGVGLWLTYGILIREWPIILSNSVTLVLTLLILVMKLRLG